MSYNTISDVPGYNATQYATLMELANTNRVSQSAVQKSLLNAINEGKSFDEAIKQVTSDLPTLPPPSVSEYNSTTIHAVMPSLTASVMAQIIDYANESRKADNQVRAANTEAIVSEIKDQVELMNSKATEQLALGITAGIVSAGASIGAMITQGKMGLTGANAQANATFAGGISGAGQGVAAIFNSASTYAGTKRDYQIKEGDAKIERTRSYNETIESNVQALNELIQKAQSALSSIQETERQTMVNIMA